MNTNARHPVVVGVDGSANGQRAMHVAARQAARTQRPLVVVHAIGLTGLIDGEHVPSHEHRPEIAREVIEWCSTLEGECPLPRPGRPRRPHPTPGRVRSDA